MPCFKNPQSVFPVGSCTQNASGPICVRTPCSSEMMPTAIVMPNAMRQDVPHTIMMSGAAQAPTAKNACARLSRLLSLLDTMLVI